MPDACASSVVVKVLVIYAYYLGGETKREPASEVQRPDVGVRSWSDGGAREHTVTTSVELTTYMATFKRLQR